MARTIRLRRGTAAQWTTADPVLAAGEPGAETDTGRVKVGDGSTAWSGLAYVGGTGGGGGSLTPGTTAQYLRGDLSWQTLSKAAVGLGSVDNTADASKPISTAAAVRFAERLRRPVRSTVCGIGDSLTGAEPQTGGSITGGLGSFAGMLSVQSHARIRYAGAFGHGGYGLGQIRDEMLPLVLAQSPLPGACLVGGGTNDVAGVGGAFSVSSRSAIVVDIVGQLLAAGIVPILMTIPPRSDSGMTVNVLRWNSWVRRYAAANGLAVIDVYRAVTGSDGQFLSGMTSDGTHPTLPGYIAAINQALADGVGDLFPGGSGGVTSRSTADTTTTLFHSGGVNLGLSTQDSNSDGIANGWSVTGSFTSASLVTPDAADDLAGNWQRLTRAAGSSGDATLTANITSGFTTGDRLAFSARIRTSGTATAAVNAYAVGAGGIITWAGSGLDGTIYAESTAASYCQIIINVGAPTGTGSATLDVGEITLTNLTTNGIA